MFEHGLLWATIMLGVTLIKAAFQATLVVYPSYKTFKAFESRSLRASQAMLLYWCITAFVSSLKEVVDQVLGTYSNFFVWKMTVLALKAAPLIIGPEKLYSLVVRPLFVANEEQVDAVVGEAHKLRDIAKDAVPAVKERDIEGVKAAAGEIVGVLKEDSNDLVAAVKEEVLELADSIQAKSAELGLVLDKQGVMGLLERLVMRFERLRDAGMNVAAKRWQQHGPLVMEKTQLVQAKGAQLYSTHAPVMRQKVIDTWSTQVVPRAQPLVDGVTNKYQNSVRPFAMSKLGRVQQLWQQHGGPLRSFYASKALPLYEQRLRPMWEERIHPFVVDSFIPAVIETLISLKDQLVDLLSPPSDEVKKQRASHKKKRREASEAKSEWKKRGMRTKNKWSASWKEVEGDQIAERKEGEVQQDSSSSSSGSNLNETVSAPSAATLTNRHSKISQDSSLTDSAAPAGELVEPSAPSMDDSGDVSGQTQKADETHIWAVSKPAGIPHESGLPLAADHNKTVLDSNIDKGSNKFNLDVQQKDVGEERNAEQWANEPRSGRLTEVQ